MIEVHIAYGSAADRPRNQHEPVGRLMPPARRPLRTSTLRSSKHRRPRRTVDRCRPVEVTSYPTGQMTSPRQSAGRGSSWTISDSVGVSPSSPRAHRNQDTRPTALTTTSKNQEEQTRTTTAQTRYPPAINDRASRARSR